jgi:hypothetical protein
MMMSHMIDPVVLSEDVNIRRLFQGFFAGRENGFVGATELFRRPGKSETPSRDCERQSSLTRRERQPKS